MKLCVFALLGTATALQLTPALQVARPHRSMTIRMDDVPQVRAEVRGQQTHCHLTHLRQQLKTPINNTLNPSSH